LTALSILGSTTALIIVLVSILLRVRITCPKLLRKPWEFLKRPFQPFLSTDEALTTLSRYGILSGEETESLTASRTMRRFDMFLSLLGVVLANTWVAAGAYQMRFHPDEPILVLGYPFVTAATWIYCFIRPLARPIETSPLDLLVLNVVHISFSVLHVGIVVSNKVIFGVTASWIPMLGAQVCQLGIALVAISIILSYPSGKPITVEIDKSPEDDVTLWGGITYSWLQPLLLKVRIQTHWKFILIRQGSSFRVGPVNSTRTMCLASAS